MRITIALLICLSGLVALQARSEDRIDIDGASIVGNRELPKVLYIVPWKKSLSGDLVGKPVQSLLDEVLAPLDRDVFRRQVEYYGASRPVQGAVESGVQVK